jgi:hypothetical protein
MFSKLIVKRIKHDIMEIKVIFKEMQEVLNHQNSHGEFPNEDVDEHNNKNDEVDLCEEELRRTPNMCHYDGKLIPILSPCKGIDNHNSNILPL